MRKNTKKYENAPKPKPSLPEHPSEKILLLLKLLRERVKVEAAFAPDEKGLNLRLLAYCMQVDNDEDREQLIRKSIGNSMGRLEDFVELVASAVEYGESTSYQLQPAKKMTLDVKLLTDIMELTIGLRDRLGGKKP